MRKYLVVSLLILHLHSYSQIKYEPGYLITNDNKKVGCLIKNNDWENNPKEFRYKLTEASGAQTGYLKDLVEFGVINISKYRRFIIDIDTSSDVLSELSTGIEPEFRKEDAFLKTLVEGKATLYLYKGKGLTRYFFLKSDSTTEQLIYKRYLITGDAMSENNKFREQLFNNFPCQTLSQGFVEKINYSSPDLINFFTIYNKCVNATSATFGKKIKKDLFNLTFRPGVNMSSLSLTNAILTSGNTDFGNKITVRLGLEAEFILPYNKNKWAIIAEPNYEYFKADLTANNFTATADYKAINFPWGVRHSFFLNDQSKIFVNALYNIVFRINPKIVAISKTNLDVGARSNIIFGLGYKYNRKFGLEVRYGSRNILGNYDYWNSKYEIISVIFGYTLF